MRHSLFLRILMIFALLFAQQAGAAHALHHALADLAQQHEGKQVPNSDTCEKCAGYVQLSSALGVGVYDFTPLLVADETIQHRAISFRSIPILAAAARGPPQSERFA